MSDLEDFEWDVLDILREWTSAVEKMPRSDERTRIVYALGMISATARIILASEDDTHA